MPHELQQLIREIRDNQQKSLELQQEQFEFIKAHYDRAEAIQDKAEALQNNANKTLKVIVPALIIAMVLLGVLVLLRVV